MNTLEQEREAFETWWNESGDVTNSGPWNPDTHIQHAWDAWVARAALAQPAAPVQAAGDVNDLLKQMRELGDAMRAAGNGVTVKIPALVSDEGRKFMRGEPSLFDRMPFGDMQDATRLLETAIGSSPHPAAPTLEPIDMVLHCPECGKQHIDAMEDAECDGEVVQSFGWSNPPHRSHLCHGCGHICRPADVPTNGVAAVKTTGKADSPIAAPAPELTPMDAVYRAMDMASLLAGAVAANNTERADTLSARLRSHLVKYMRPVEPEAPVAVQPLTSGQIARCMCCVSDPLLWGKLGEVSGILAEEFTRAVEAAHGIKQPGSETA